MVKFLVLGLAVLALLGGLTQALWNWLIPDLFGGPAVSFWQALGLLALSKILFFTFGRSFRSRGTHWGYRWKREWEKMSPEQRDQLKARMKEKWCSWEGGTKNPAGSNG